MPLDFWLHVLWSCDRTSDRYPSATKNGNMGMKSTSGFCYSKTGIKISGSVLEEAKVLFFGDGVGLGFN